jgi:fumarate hydratase class II
VLSHEIRELMTTFEEKEHQFKDAMKTGRSNGSFIDMPVAKLFSNWREYLQPYIGSLDQNIKTLLWIPVGSAYETNIDSLKKVFDHAYAHEQRILKGICDEITIDNGQTYSFTSSKNRMNALAQLSCIVDYSSTLSSLSSVLMKISNDIRFLSSGPRSGFGELVIPENEPGSSIMPGKVNPTQCEALTMVAAQVMGCHQSILIANSSSLFESNTFKPLIANNVLRSTRLLSDGIKSFRLNCAKGIDIIEGKMKDTLDNLI